MNYINHILLILLLTLNIGCSTNEKESNKGLKTSLPSINKKPLVNSQKGKEIKENPNATLEEILNELT